ncbi:MAG: SCO family protein [Ignavibacteriaceae bacterium]|jgi:protein SCO1/2
MKYFAIALISLFFYSCQSKFPEKEFVGNSSKSLVNQDSVSVDFPKRYKGKILLVSFIFTNCPDICPLTTHNLQRIQQKVKEEKIDNVSFAAISFDPERDTPLALKNFAEVRNLDLSNYNVFSGKREDVKSLMETFHIVAIPGDTTFTDDGDPVYFFTHTDRITLVDHDQNIRKSYKGSEINLDEIINDIKNLGD